VVKNNEAEPLSFLSVLRAATSCSGDEPVLAMLEDLLPLDIAILVFITCLIYS